jgi:hypothetical protein
MVEIGYSISISEVPLPSWIQPVDFAPPVDELRRMKLLAGQPCWVEESEVVGLEALTDGGSVVVATTNQFTWAELCFDSAGLSRESLDTIYQGFPKKSKIPVVIFSFQKDPLRLPDPRTKTIDTIVKEQLASRFLLPEMSRVVPKKDPTNLVISNTSGLLRVNLWQTPQ